MVEKNLIGVISDSLLKENISSIEDQLFEIRELKENQTQNTTDFGTVLDYLNEFFLNPSKVWKELPFRLKLKLQWFVFPQGIILDNTEIRTNEVCNLFKLKQEFFGINSSIVHLGDLSTNTPSMIKSSPLQNIRSGALFHFIENDLILLDKIMNTPD